MEAGRVCYASEINPECLGLLCSTSEEEGKSIGCVFVTMQLNGACSPKRRWKAGKVELHQQTVI